MGTTNDTFDVCFIWCMTVVVFVSMCVIFIYELRLSYEAYRQPNMEYIHECFCYFPNRFQKKKKNRHICKFFH